MKRTLSLFVGLIACLTGCSGVKVEDYAGQEPKLDVREYFNGPIEAHGMFIDWKGKADSFFHIVMKGSWLSNEGKLEETFTFSSGKTDQRVWKISMTDDNRFTGTAHDVVGIAQGKQYGNAVNMRYVLRVETDGSTYDLSMDDWMYRIDQHTVLNRITMRKFGIKVGELIVTFKKK